MEETRSRSPWPCPPEGLSPRHCLSPGEGQGCHCSGENQQAHQSPWELGAGGRREAMGEGGEGCWAGGRAAGGSLRGPAEGLEGLVLSGRVGLSGTELPLPLPLCPGMDSREAQEAEGQQGRPGRGAYPMSDGLAVAAPHCDAKPLGRDSASLPGCCPPEELAGPV